MHTRISFRIMLVVALSLIGREALSQWQAITQLKFVNVKCFLSVNDSTLLVGGDNWTLLRSTDAGSTWSNVLAHGIVADTILSLGKGGKFIFAGAYGAAGVYRSSDDGVNWSAANQGLPAIAQVYGFTYVDSTLFAATNYGVYSSKNLGLAWKVDTAGLGMNQPLYLGPISGTVGITSVGSRLYTIKPQWGGGVYATGTDSIAWSPIGLDTVWGYAIASIDTNVFAGVPQGVFQYSGSGKTWYSRSNGLPNYLCSCMLAAIDTLLFARTGTYEFFLSSDLGHTWKQINDGVLADKSVRAMIATKSYLIAGTNEGAWRLPLSSVKTGMNGPHEYNPTYFVLSQNYPNPFNPSTTIRFGLPTRSRVRLGIYNILGQQVAELVNGEMNAGYFEKVWDANVASGLYIYRIEAVSLENPSKRFVDVKKMMLLK